MEQELRGVNKRNVLIFSECEFDPDSPRTGSTFRLFLSFINACKIYLREKKLRGFSPQANYTDRATAAIRRS
jgi:hypothetical protein